MVAGSAALQKPDIEKPRWDQATYAGRAAHFVVITNPFNLFCSKHALSHSKSVVEKYRAGSIDPNLSVDELWRAKHIYDSAFHPDTKQKMFILGRMSAQVPTNMLITGCMMTFYKTTPAVIFWQWINQSFNAVVNYTNRSGENPIPMSQLLISYASATGGALATALGLNSFVKKSPPLVGRFVPFAAVAAANCVNIPLMRIREVQHGISTYDESGDKVGDSKKAAKTAICMVVISRILMATPGMIFPPIIMNKLERKSWLKTRPYLSAPIQVGLVGIFLIFATPLCCALFPQQSSMASSHLEKHLQEKLPEKTSKVFYNKGL